MPGKTLGYLVYENSYLFIGVVFLEFFMLIFSILCFYYRETDGNSYWAFLTPGNMSEKIEF